MQRKVFILRKGERGGGDSGQAGISLSIQETVKRGKIMPIEIGSSHGVRGGGEDTLGPLKKKAKSRNGRW